MSNDLAKLQRTPRQIARWQNAQQELITHRHAHGLAIYQELVQRFPGVAQLWFELGMAAMGELDFGFSMKAFRRAEELAARDSALLILLAQQYHRLRNLERASACFHNAVAAEPSSIQARLNLAAWLERERKLDEAAACIEPCLLQHAKNPQVLTVHAMLLHRQGRNSEAETVLRDIIKSDTGDANARFASRHLLAVILDELGQYEEAIRWLCEAKAIAARMSDVARMERDYDRADDRRRQLLASLTPEMIRQWRGEEDSAPMDFQLALLGGHPRSGTTLLEQILGAHPDISSFDESEAFVTEIWEQIAPMQAPQALSAGALDGLSPTRRAEIRRKYLKSLLRATDDKPTAKVVLDKNPSPTAALHLGLRIFPRMKVLIALRDPRDVIISCFFQTLMLTPTNANFLSLERAAKHYSDLMDVWLRLRELGGFDWLETRYEDVVHDLLREGRRVTQFLGLEWHPAQERHQEATKNKFVFSPTYSDVTKPIHNRAIGRWQHYAEALAPIQPGLAKYCQAFGYGGMR